MSIETARAGLRWALLALLVLSPLPFGSVEPWAVLAIELWAAALGAGALLILAKDPEGLPPRAKWMLLPAGGIAGIGVLQLLPLPHAWTRLVAAPTAHAREEISRLLPEISSTLSPQSLEPPATVDALMRFLSYVLIGLAAAVAIRSKIHLRQAALAIAASGAFQGIYGAAEYLTGHQHIFGYAKKHAIDVASGTFINRNHFAGYLAMTLPFALGLVIEAYDRLPRSEGWRARVLNAWEPDGRRLLFGGFAAAAIWAGVILSYSRSGLAVAILGTSLMTLAAWRRRRAAWILLAVLAIPTALLLWQQVRAPGERFVEESWNMPTLSGRIPVWRASAGMIPDYWLLGTGLGTFEPAFELYRPAEVHGRWDHAHNDWLEGVVEGGIAAVAILAVAGAMLVVARRRGVVPAENVHLILASSLAALAAATVDFPLRLPAIACLTVTILGAMSDLAGHAATDPPGPGIHRHLRPASQS